MIDIKMRNPLIALAVLFTAISLCPSKSYAQRGGGQRGQRGANAEPSPPHDPHDLSGIWVRRGGTLTVSDTPPAFTPDGKKRFDANKPSYGPRAIAPALGNDPMGNCDPLGIPRLLVLENNPFDFEFIQIPGRVLQIFDRHHVYRIIWVDGRELPKDPDPRLMGYSVGRWEGDTFVVESNGFDERTWLDHFGNPHSDEMRLEERYHRLDRDHMQLVMTLTDPKIYTQPWVSETKDLRLSPLKDFVDELFCIPSEEQAFNRRIRNPAGGVLEK
jgi:hypothetical protein